MKNKLSVSFHHEIFVGFNWFQQIIRFIYYSSNMADKYGFSDLECKIILDQIERRAKYRKEFLKQRTDPCKHTKEVGHVFDKAMQQFLSMKATQLDHFQFNVGTIRFALLAIVMPMVSLGYAFWVQRQKLEYDRRCGKIKYKDRPFKLK